LHFLVDSNLIPLVFNMHTPTNFYSINVIDVTLDMQYIYNNIMMLQAPKCINTMVDCTKDGIKTTLILQLNLLNPIIKDWNLQMRSSQNLWDQI